MADITVDKTELLAKLAANREAHAATYVEAVAAFRVAAYERIHKMADEIEQNPLPKRIAFDLPIPEHHTADYDRAIRMLNMDTNEHVVLSEEAYAKLVDDQWDWQHAWHANTVAYTARAAG